ncbi:hypothetical protein ACFWGN_17795 [Oerskovia sp. NPDC060338]|uniref:hypothetical protein n=1 Tax=Oerskovia sp. NPDC060338 TaxID=3347100 RepID=UPI00364E157F
MGISVEVLPDAGAPQVGVTVTGLSGSGESVVSVQVSWDAGRTWHGVRGAERVVVTGGDFFRDHVPPLNVPATYRLVVHSGAVTPSPLEATVTVPSSWAWIQDPLNPRSAVRVSPTHGEDSIRLLSASASRLTRRQPVDLATPEGARLPVASIGRRQAPSQVPIVLQDLAAAQGALVRALDELFDSAGQVVIRGLPVEIPLDPVAHVAIPDLDESPVVGGVVGHREWVLTVTQVRPTSMRIVIPWWTYDQVRALWSPRTYNAVKATRPGDTYIDWSRDPEVP